VIIEEKVMIDFLRGYIAALTDSREEYHTPDDNLLNINFKVLKESRDRIVNSVLVESRRPGVRKLIDAVISNEEKMTNAINMKDPAFNEYLQAYFERSISDLKPTILENGNPAEMKSIYITPEKIVNYFPLRVVYKAKTLSHEGYLFLPEKKDFEKIQKFGNHEEILGAIISRNMKNGNIIDEKNTSITIGNRTYKFTEPAFARAVERFDWEVANNFLLKKLSEAVPSNIGKRRWSETYANSELMIEGDPDSFNIKLPDEYKDLKMLLVIVTNPSAYPEVNIDAIVANKRLHLKINNYKSSIDTVKDDISKVLQMVKEKVESLKPTVDMVFEAAEKRGYKIAPQIADPLEAKYFLTKETPVYRLKKGNINIVLAVDDKNTINIDYEIKKDIKRREITTDRVLSYLKGQKIGYNLRLLPRLLIVEGKERGVQSVDNVFDAIESIDKTLDRMIADFDKEKEETKKKIQIPSDELATALFLVDYATSGINIEEISGRNRSFIYTTIAKVIKQIDPTLYEDLKKRKLMSEKPIIKDSLYTITESLLKKGYIKISPDGEVVINDKTTLREILKQTGYFTDLHINDINTNVVAKLIDIKIMSEPYETYLDYEKLGLATPKLMSIIINNLGYSIPPSVLMKEYNGKTIWEQLDVATKEKYITKRAWAEDLYQILTDYREAFKDYHDPALKRLTRLGWSMATEYLAKYEPKLITNENELQLYKDESGFVGIRMGDFVAQIGDNDKIKQGENKLFIVYGINEKVGVPVTAKTVEEGVSKVAPIYQNFITKEFAKLKELEAQGEVRIWEMGLRKKFNLYTVSLRRYPSYEVFIVKPGVLKEIEEYKKKLEEEEKEREGKRRQLVSA